MTTTDWYKICEDGVVKLLQDKLPPAIINPATKTVQVCASDSDVLGRGFDYFALAWPGAFPTSNFATDIVKVDWEIGLDIFSRCNAGEAANWDVFRAYRAEIFQLFVSYRTLGRVRTVERAALRAEGEPDYITAKGMQSAPPIYITQPLVVTVTQVIHRTGGEYPQI